MLYIKNLKDGLAVFKALGSDVRMKIVELLSERGEMNMNEIASALKLTNGALTSHIRKLEECGIVRTITEYTGHGNQKRCSMKVDQILLDGRPEETKEANVCDTEIRIADFSDCRVSPPCGLCSVDGQLGPENDPRYFAHPQRVRAGLLWFSEGYVEYRIPGIASQSQRISQITFYFEISSDQSADSGTCSSDICFSLNGQRIGAWQTPAEFRRGKGIYTPAWWSGSEKQFGLLKMIVVTQHGTYLDGLKISDVSLEEIDFGDSGEIRLRIEAREKRGQERQSGVALYGAGFGNYNQDIHVRIHYVSDNVSDTGRKEEGRF